jgi:transcriptional regulator
MHQPAQFREDDLAVQHALIRAHPLGLLISTGPDGIIANPVPFLLYPEDGERGTLRCHLSRANEQWQALAASPEVLVVFQGVERYITPSWYPAKTAHGKVVPTWNYAIVQARGRAVLHHDAAWLHAHVSALSATNEANRAEPWAVGDAPEAFIAGQLKGIVGIEIAIAGLEGKWKASQNRAIADRAGVAEGLLAEGDEVSLAMAAMVRERGGV